MDARAELNAEIRKARGWLIAVGAIMFAVDMFQIHVQYGKLLPSDFKTKITIISAAILVTFIGLAVLVSKKPKLALILGLTVFWGIVVVNGFLDPKSIAQGFLLKILFTAALIKGLKSADRAQVLMQDLGEVFD